MIKRALVAAAVTAVVACAALLLWSARRSTYDVVGRLGSAGGPVATPEQSATKVKLGTASRSAVRATAEPFEMDLGEPGAVLVFSFGVRYLGQEKPSVQFVIEADGPGGWQPAFDETVSKPSPGERERKSPLRPWRDRVVNLEEVVPGARRVRFRAGAEGGDAQDVEAYWGSVLTLRRKGPLARLQEGWRALFQRREPPNVIVISLDTLSARHLTSFGNVPGVSPSIDRFLRESFSFTNAVAQYPNTLVSHASLFTGLYPKNHGVYFSDPFLRSETLASRLAARGYVTAAITEDAYVDSGFGFDGGFDWYENGRVKDVTQISGHAKHTFSDAIAWLYAYGVQTKFFLFVHTYEVHTPYAIQTKGAERIVEAIDPGYEGPFASSYPAGLFEMAHNFGNQLLAQPELRHLPALYAGEISYLDRVFGRFMHQLSRMPFADRTLVVVLSDHGEEFGEHGKLGHGETLYGQALHVPLGFRWTGTIEPGTSDTPVQLIDVFPTVLDLLGIEGGQGIDGRTLRPLLAGRTSKSAARPAFAELRYAPFADERAASGDCARSGLPADCQISLYAVRTNRFKLIASTRADFTAFYDLREDPGELHDVREAFPAELAAHRALLDAYVADAPERKAGEPTPASSMDPATRERLRALGYAE